MKLKRQTCRLFISSCLALAVGGGWAQARAAGYESSDEDDDDMLQPSELNNSQVVAHPANTSTFFLAGGILFGQARSTESDSAPGAGILASFEPGYQVQNGSWNRLELSAAFLAGQLGFRMESDRLSGRLTVPIEFGMLARMAYGYSLGSHITGKARFGVGPIVGRVQGEVEGVDVQTSTSTGIGVQLGWGLDVPVTDHVDFTGGLSLTHMELDVGRLRGQGTSYNYGRTVVINYPSLDLGLRYRF